MRRENSFVNELQLHDIDRAQGERDRRARCPAVRGRRRSPVVSFENNLRIGRSPASTPRTACGPHCALSDAEHTNPPGMASTSTPNCFDLRRRGGSSSGTTGRSFTTESSPLPWIRRARTTTPCWLSVRSRCVEEHDLADLRHPARPGPSDAAAERWSDSGTVSFELDGIGALDQPEQLSELFAREAAGLGR